MACNSLWNRKAPNTILSISTPCVAVVRSRYDNVATKLMPWDHLEIGKVSVHWTHQMSVLQGVLFCISCGYYAFHLVRTLHKPCTHARTAHGKRAIEAFQQGQLPKGVKPVSLVGSKHPKGGNVAGYTSLEEDLADILDIGIPPNSGPGPDLSVEFDTLVPFVPCNNASIPAVSHESSDDFSFAVSPFSEHPGVASCPPDTSNFDNPDVNPFEFADSDSD